MSLADLANVTPASWDHSRFLAHVLGKTSSDKEKDLSWKTFSARLTQEALLAREEGAAAADARGDSIPYSTGRVGPAKVGMDVSNVAGSATFMSADEQGGGPLEAVATSNFASIRANCCVFAGRWMYEVTLGTAGIMQVGWAVLDCPFSNENGVGDSIDSFALDGKRVKKWNVSAQQYGEAWVAGDIFGVCIDLGMRGVGPGKIEFYRNGKALGVAFDNVPVGPEHLNAAYFPTVSLSLGERLAFNFGASPLKFPVHGYSPLQAGPRAADLGETQFLTGCLSRLAPFLTEVEHQETRGARPTTERSSTSASSVAVVSTRRVDQTLESPDAAVLTSLLWDRLAPLLTIHGRANTYSIASSLVPLLTDVLRLGLLHFDAFIEFMCAALDEWELDLIWPVTLRTLALACHSQSITPDMMETAGEAIDSRSYASFEDRISCFPALALATALFRHPKVRVNLFDNISESDEDLSSGSIFNWFECFFAMRAQNIFDLAKLVGPDSLWWPQAQRPVVTVYPKTPEEIEQWELAYTPEERAKFAAAGAGAQNRSLQERATRKLRFLYLSHHYLARDLMSSSAAAVALSSKPSFLQRWLRTFHRRNIDSDGPVPRPGSADPATASGVLFALLAVFGDPMRASAARFNRQQPDESSTSVAGFPLDLMEPERQWAFGEGNRMSGLLSHVRKEYPLDNSAKAMRSDPRLVDDVLHTVIILYKFNVANRFKHAQAVVGSRDGSVQQLHDSRATVEELQSRADRGALSPPDTQRLHHARLAEQVSLENASNEQRIVLWGKVTLFEPEQMRDLYSFVRYAAATLLHLGLGKGEGEGNVSGRAFRYVPEWYLDPLVDAVHVLRRAEPPFAFVDECIPLDSVSLENWEQNMDDLGFVLNALIAGFGEDRIVNPGVREFFLQSVGTLLALPDFLRAFEHHTVDRAGLIRCLMKSFNQRMLVPVGSIILRFFRGTEFAPEVFGIAHYLHTMSPLDRDMPIARQRLQQSDVLQHAMAALANSDPVVVNEFLNQIFNSLNWSASELHVAAKEVVQALTENPSSTISSQGVRRISVMYEISHSLVRLIEACASVMPLVLLEDGDALNRTRMIEVMLFVLNRFAGGTDSHAFRQLREMCKRTRVQGISGVPFEDMTELAITAPIVGTILAFRRPSTEESVKAAILSGERQDMSSFLDAISTQVAAGAITMDVFDHLNDMWSRATEIGEASAHHTTELERLRAFVEDLRHATEALLEKQKAATVGISDSGGLARTESSDFCPICFAAPIDTTFRPCGHRSCASCIKRQMLNVKKCFFCNTEIESLERDPSL